MFFNNAEAASGKQLQRGMKWHKKSRKGKAQRSVRQVQRDTASIPDVEFRYRGTVGSQVPTVEIEDQRVEYGDEHKNFDYHQARVSFGVLRFPFAVLFAWLGASLCLSVSLW